MADHVAVSPVAALLAINPTKVFVLPQIDHEDGKETGCGFILWLRIFLKYYVTVTDSCLVDRCISPEALIDVGWNPPLD